MRAADIVCGSTIGIDDIVLWSMLWCMLWCTGFSVIKPSTRFTKTYCLGKMLNFQKRILKYTICWFLTKQCCCPCGSSFAGHRSSRITIFPYFIQNHYLQRKSWSNFWPNFYELLIFKRRINLVWFNVFHKFAKWYLMNDLNINEHFRIQNFNDYMVLCNGNNMCLNQFWEKVEI